MRTVPWVSNHHVKRAVAAPFEGDIGSPNFARNPAPPFNMRVFDLAQPRRPMSGLRPGRNRPLAGWRKAPPWR